MTNRSVGVDSGRIIENITFTSAADSYTFSGEPLNLSHGGLMTINGVANATHQFDNDLVLQPENATSDGFYTINDSISSRSFIINGDITGGTTTGTIMLRYEGTGTGHSQGSILGSISDGGAEGGVALEIATRMSTTSNGLSLGGNTHSGGTFLRRYPNSTLGGAVVMRDAQAFGTGVIDIEIGNFRGTASQSNTYTLNNDLILRGYFRSSGNNIQLTWTGPVVLDADPAIANAFGSPGSGDRVHYVGTGAFNGVISEADPNNPVAFVLQPNGGDIELNAANTFSEGLIFASGSRTSNAIVLGPDGTVGTGNIIAPEGRFGGFGGPDRTLSNNIILDGGLQTVGGTVYTFTGDVTVGTTATASADLWSNGSDTGGAIFHGVLSDGGFDRPLRMPRGTFLWTADNELTGTIRVERVTLQIGDGGSTGLIGTSTVELGGESATGRPTVIFNRTGSYTVENAFINADDAPSDRQGGTLTFQGGGTATLTGASTWTPYDEETTALIVASGTTVLMDGSHVTTTGDYLIQTGGTLGGSGLIDLDGGNGTIDLQAGAFLAPGSENTPGTLNLDANLVLTQLDGNSGNLIFRLGSASDQLVNDGLILYSTFNFGDFQFIADSGFGAGTYDLMLGAFAGDGLGTNTTGTINGLDAELVFDGISTLSLTVIPEPATVAAILGALALALVGWRRRQSRQFKI